jgi:ribosomal protein S18 acetylase RimI-like enzyme
MDDDTIEITRIAHGLHWHALDDGEVVGRGHALRRPDGRVFLSVDSWQDDAFHRLAAAMLSDLPAPLYTIVDDDDLEVRIRWQDAGFAVHRREREYVIPTAAEANLLEQVSPPSGVTILPAGQADEVLLAELDLALRAEVDRSVGWQSMPAEVLIRPDRTEGVVDPSKYVVAARHGQYVGLARVAPLPRRPRLGLVAVRADHRRQGIARALLAEVVSAQHRSGIRAISAEVDERNAPALALFEGVGARHEGGAVEMLHRRQSS